MLIKHLHVAKYTGKIEMPYGESDYVLYGKKTSKPLKSPMPVSVGDGSEDKINLVIVS